jgi:hypothetical protein
MGFGDFRIKSTVWASTLAAVASAGTRVLTCDPGERRRSSENTTSSAVKSLGETGDEFQLLIALGQAFHHVAERAEREGLVQRVGIKRVEVALEGVFEGLGVGRVEPQSTCE